MKTWIRRSLLGLIGAAALVGGLAACSHSPRHHGPMSEADAVKMRERMVDRVSRELELDAAQQARLGTLADVLAQQRKALRGSQESPRAAIAPLIAGTQFDRSAAQSLVDTKVAAMQSGSPAVVNAAGDFYDSLRPEQQAKVRAFLERGPRRFGFFGRD